MTRSDREQALVDAVEQWIDWLDDGQRYAITGKAWAAIRAMRQALEPYERERWAAEEELEARGIERLQGRA